MAKLLKFNEPNTWGVVDPDFDDKGNLVDTVFGEVLLNWGEAVFSPATETNIGNNFLAKRLRELADLMDALEVEQAEAARAADPDYAVNFANYIHKAAAAGK